MTVLALVAALAFVAGGVVSGFATSHRRRRLERCPRWPMMISPPLSHVIRVPRER